MRILIESLPHVHQRYDTCGDYWTDKNGLQIRISEMPDKRYMLLVAIHELIEHVLADHAGVTNKQIDDFDFAFEANRKPEDGEPGDDPRCPVYKQHQFATGIERILAAELQVDWGTYENFIDGL